MEVKAPGFLTEQGLKKALDEGYILEVVCLEQPERRNTQWYGVWIVRAVSEDGTIEKLLVTSRQGQKKDTENRKFKTAVGLISFLSGLGFTQLGIPFEVGGRAAQLPTSRNTDPVA